VSLVETDHTGRNIRYKLRGFGLPADQLMFPAGGGDENTAEASSTEKISVADYFIKKYKKRLVYPFLPCIDGTNGFNKRANWLPMEMVTVSIISYELLG
jgi:hypothetical protein